MDIVACTDKGFVMPTGVMMYSVCDNNADIPITFHIIVDGSVTESDKSSLKDTISVFLNKTISFYKVDADFFEKYPKRPDHQTITNATYYRLVLADILPSNIDKVIYLDGDIICRYSLLPMWNIDIRQYAVAACPDSSEPIIEINNYLNLHPWSGYFNAGVLLINLKYWRDNNVTDSFLSFIEEHGNILKCQDQGVMNYILNERKLMLPIKYNLVGALLCTMPQSFHQKYQNQLVEAINDPVIVHFTHNKPWFIGCRHPYRNLFYKYQLQTLWKDTPLLERRPIKIRIIKFFSGFLRKLKLIPELPPYGKGYLPNLKQLD